MIIRPLLIAPAVLFFALVLRNNGPDDIIERQLALEIQDLQHAGFNITFSKSLEECRDEAGAVLSEFVRFCIGEHEVYLAGSPLWSSVISRQDEERLLGSRVRRYVYFGDLASARLAAARVAAELARDRFGARLPTVVTPQMPPGPEFTRRNAEHTSAVGFIVLVATFLLCRLIGKRPARSDSQSPDRGGSRTPASSS